MGTNALYTYCPAVSQIDNFTFWLFIIIYFYIQVASIVDNEFGSNLLWIYLNAIELFPTLAIIF